MILIDFGLRAAINGGINGQLTHNQEQTPKKEIAIYIGMIGKVRGFVFGARRHQF